MKAANFIGGEWLASAGGRTYEKRNPFRTADVVGEFPASEASDVDSAVDAATRDSPAGGPSCRPSNAARSCFGRPM